MWLCEVTDLPVDVHLMIEDPDRWAPEYAKLGAASVSFHMGATHAPVRLARQLREMGCKACFAVRPAEPVEPIFDILDEFDMILIMTVEPGFGGQKFLDNQMAKVRRLRDEITRRGLATKIQVDGGVSPKTAHIVAEAGADVLVAGSAVPRILRKPLIPSVRRLKPHSRPEPTNISRIDTNNEDF